MASDADRLREILLQIRDVLISIRDAPSGGGGGILETILAKVSNLEVLTMGVREELDNLIAKVTEVETKADSLIALVQGIIQMLRDNAADPAEIRALADRLEAQTAEIQGAIDSVPPPPTP